MSSADERSAADELAALEEEERELSARRRRLFDRIDRAADPTSVEHLVSQERELSARRRELHARIDALRAGGVGQEPQDAGEPSASSG